MKYKRGIPLVSSFSYESDARRGYFLLLLTREGKPTEKTLWTTRALWLWMSGPWPVDDLWVTGPRPQKRWKTSVNRGINPALTIGPWATKRQASNRNERLRNGCDEGRVGPMLVFCLVFRPGEAI